MWNSMFRRYLAVAAISILPAAAVAEFARETRGIAWLTLAAAVPGLVGGVLLARSLDERLRQTAAFAGRILSPTRSSETLPAGDDDIGRLSSTLNAIAPRIDDLVERLTSELARREAMLATMVEGVVAIDSKLKITFCNEAFAHAVGQRQVSVGLPLIQVVREPALFGTLEEVVVSQVTIRRRIRMSVGGRSFEVCASPLKGEAAPGAMAILHDVTPAEELDRLRRDFVANVSHEFRTPLAAVRGYAETLLDGGLEDVENRYKFVETILANAVRLNNIAADLLTLSELEDGRPQAEAGPIDVADVVSAAIRAVEPAARLCGVDILSDEVPPVWVRGHRLRFEQAIVNLLDNAVKFNKPGGQVRIEVGAASGDLLQIQIADTGIGIPAHDLTRVFERFYRVDKARSRQVDGTGLGLSIVKHAIQQMGGSVTAESRLGAGSTFRIVVPAVRMCARVS